jgi:hypothetical protein
VSELAGKRRTSGALVDERPLEDTGTSDGVVMDEWLEEASEFDGVVGFSLESAERPPSQSSQVYVAAPSGPSGSWAMGLEDDVRLLARAFAAGGTDLCRELVEALPPRSSKTSQSRQQKEDVHVALHGLELDSSDEEELRDLIWMLVEKRIAGGGARP